jgi:hypothetical protein
VNGYALKAGLGSLQIGESDHWFRCAYGHRQIAVKLKSFPQGLKARVKCQAKCAADFPAR